jgi:putative ABC transport system ATP-binding protein
MTPNTQLREPMPVSPAPGACRPVPLQSAGCAVRINAICKQYTRGRRTVSVFKDLSFEVTTGEFVSITGPSGSGKSTLLNLIAGLDTLDSGAVIVQGVDVQSMNAVAKADWRARTVGFVFQLYHLLPFLTARENVEVPLALAGIKSGERKRRAMTALQLTGIEACAAQRPAELSGGQAQRVAIARALAGDPQILLCDEPTGDLDRDSAREILEVLAALREHYGKTILMVTHDPFAASYASRRVRLEKGVLVSTGE